MTNIHVNSSKGANKITKKPNLDEREKNNLMDLISNVNDPEIKNKILMDEE